MFAFTTRAEYLEFTHDWKERYAALSQQIRDTKKAIKDENRKKGFTYLWYDLRSQKDQAANMLYERHASKVEASRQYQETK